MVSPGFSEYGFQQTRGFRALKVWMTMQQFGLTGYQAVIEENIALAGYLADCVSGSPDLALMAPPSLSVVCFRYTGLASRVDLQASPDSSAGLQARPDSSAGLQARPGSSAGLQARPSSSSAGLQARPDSSAGLQARPGSSAGLQACPGEEKIAALNRALLERLQLGGEAFLTSTELRGRFVLRACIVNHRSRREDVDRMLETVRAIGRDLVRQG